jgi:hypothetical protein
VKWGRARYRVATATAGSRGNGAWALNFYTTVIADTGDQVSARRAEIGVC